ncbi:glutaredoxin family protein [Massilia sp. Dwa41.01b]|uniref:glutaredoxin family protein n=1 Tax=unclassified Massilia TaxID=2609279 RepID=UPI0016034A3E|nr:MULTISPECIES: glutaredoxin family protein [unclassified Massilia]QNA87658.1 glutaredoxin family protein [Massilia sp. Dwa41.01b]QNA98560.1 glutaredoxin family protein [Massilia sp. Se16.2.3]
MPTICPKCAHVRPPNATNPEWQCPVCGVCYAKVGQAQAVVSTAAPPPAQAWDIPWGKLLLLGVLACAGWASYQHWNKLRSEETEEFVALDPRAMAATVRPGDVVMYTTTTCVYCHQAKAWLNQYGFPFKECNMTVDRSCQDEFMRRGATGTPYLLVRNQEMKNGFDSDEFLRLLDN